MHMRDDSVAGGIHSPHSPSQKIKAAAGCRKAHRMECFVHPFGFISHIHRNPQKVFGKKPGGLEGDWKELC